MTLSNLEKRSKMTNQLPTLQNSSLAAYLKSINAQKELSAEEERELAVRYREHEDVEAAQQLVLSHLRYVVHVARRFMGYGLPVTDLIQEGNIGLMKAVKRYDPSRNNRLITYAAHWIKAEIYEFILKNWKLVRVATTKAQRKLFFNLKKHRNSLEPMSDSEIKKLACDLNIPEKDVRDMEVRMTEPEVSFNIENDSDDSSPVLAPEQYLGDNTYNPELVYEQEHGEEVRKQMLEEAMSKLDTRSRDIITRRWLADQEKRLPLQKLAKEYGVTSERIRQIEHKAILQMKNSIEGLGYQA